jgi:hypothetical protein
MFDTRHPATAENYVPSIDEPRNTVGLAPTSQPRPDKAHFKFPTPIELIAQAACRTRRIQIAGSNFLFLLDCSFLAGRNSISGTHKDARILSLLGRKKAMYRIEYDILAQPIPSIGILGAFIQCIKRILKPVCRSS